MNKLMLMLLWPPAVFMTYPPIHAGPKQSTPIKAQENIDDMEPAMIIKRTNIKKLMETGVASTQVLINGKTALCDVPGCTESPTNFWVDSESGCRSSRCDKHK